MGARKAFPLRLSAGLYDELRRWAAAEFRSVNGQIEYILKQAVDTRARGKRSGGAAEPEPAGPEDKQTGPKA
jgi:hypothetical protein